MGLGDDYSARFGRLGQRMDLKRIFIDVLPRAYSLVCLFLDVMRTSTNFFFPFSDVVSNAA
jgi:hypothetical protein